VVCLDRRRQLVYDEAAVQAKFGVLPSSIPDYLALVGDDADGIPGIPGWGARSAGAVLACCGHIDAIPDRESDWPVSVRGAATLARNLRERRPEAALYRRLATLRTDVPLPEELHDLAWRGARRAQLHDLCREIGEDDLIDRIPAWRD
jgi:5'-3' exonuclease